MNNDDPDTAKRFDKLNKTGLEVQFNKAALKMGWTTGTTKFMGLKDVKLVSIYTHYMYDTMLAVMQALEQTRLSCDFEKETFNFIKADKDATNDINNYFGSIHNTKSVDTAKTVSNWSFKWTNRPGRVPTSSEAHIIAQTLIEKMAKINFISSTGLVQFDANNDRLADLAIYQLQDAAPKRRKRDTSSIESKLENVLVGRYVVSEKKLYMFNETATATNPYNLQKIKYGTKSGKPPGEDVPPESAAERAKRIAGPAGGCAGAALIVLGLLGYWLYRRQMLKKELHDATWLIQWDDVRLMKTGDVKRTSGESITKPLRNTQMSGQTAQTAQTAATLKSGSMGAFSVTLLDEHYASIQGGTEKVWLKPFAQPTRVSAHSSAVVLNLAFPSARMLIRIGNDNLAKFCGVTLPTADESSHAYVMFRFMAKNSLAYILGNTNVELNDDFKSSLVRDMVAGVSQLQATAIGSHGFLHADNVVVDSRFTASLTDYGVPFVHDDLEFVALTIQMVNNLEDLYLYKLFYRGPELLRGGMPPHGTKKGDIYSLGILFAQTWTRLPPFKIPTDESDQTTPVRSQLFDIILGVSPLQRPDMELFANEPMKALIRDMWLEDPNLRPDVTSIMKTLKKMPGFFRGSILDNLIKRLEAYAENLEKTIAVRTEELNEEKFKTEQLLFQILPRTVADDLKLGRPVMPEAFASVTIFYSDIVGFTTICAVSTPLQVVGLLNSLYTLFDNTINLFDAYKVETIGDAYIVVSGLPERNGDMHPAEIARLSLSLTQAVMNYKMPHLPGRPLQMRVGMHSGSVVAGVVGMLMPRYCLFGDTVLRAGKMESTSEPDRVQCSEAARDLLEANFTGLFFFEERGEMEVFGKTLVTFFLLGTSMPLHVLQGGATFDVRAYSTRQSFM